MRKLVTALTLILSSSSVGAVTFNYEGIHWVEGVGFRPKDGIDVYPGGKTPCKTLRVYKDLANDSVVSENTCGDSPLTPFEGVGLPDNRDEALTVLSVALVTYIVVTVESPVVYPIGYGVSTPLWPINPPSTTMLTSPLAPVPLPSSLFMMLGSLFILKKVKNKC